MPDPCSRRRYLRLAAAAGTLGVAGCSQRLSAGRSGPTGTGTTTTTTPATDKVDDWQFDPDEAARSGSTGGSSGSVTYTSAQTESVEMSADASDDVGLTAGGAMDANNFRDNVDEGYLPIPLDLSYEGLFNQYYFDTGSDRACTSLFCPSYSTAVSPDPLSGETERYLTVGLNSGITDFERKTLNLVVVLDISGSMSSPFDRYYYDRFGNRHEVENYTERPKIDVATDVVASMTEHLRGDDRLGVVLFNDESYVAKPMREVRETDMDAIRDHVQELRADGGTNFSAGAESGTDLLAEYADADQSEYETRMLFLTDAMPNRGTTREGGLVDIAEENAAENVYSTFVGIGVDFNTELVDSLTAVRGANYYSVHSADQFERRIDEEFEYMVTPLVFDLSLELDADGYDVEQVYGTSAAGDATDSLIRANTLFPSPTEGGRTRGGVILAKVRRTGGDPELRLTASYETRTGERRERTRTVEFPSVTARHYDNSGIRKAVLLSRYADLLRSWMVDERTGEYGPEDVEPPADDYLGRWERQSDPLTVSETYRERFAAFADHLEREMAALGDDELERELELLRELADREANAAFARRLSAASSDAR
ncbi:VWA domain-containing protein [Halostella sp. JP-L12]|uniref:vWA domain-containing protein n=1 Tax=Halostella TaxID=1843185 RepID=UPI000EF788A8|nr:MULTISPECIES: VWA domain-containing protein [Halostella]NHN46133.1 VWA domain-containing protein [Halostella sp. JP-L12]